MIDTPVHSLTFGDLVWVEEGANPPDASGITYRVRAQDATFGTAVPVTAALLWLGRVGGPVAWDSTPNREPVFRITVEAADSDLLARGEMALQLACEQPTELTWTPPDGAGEPSVFDVVWSHLEPVFDRDGLTGVGMEETVLRTRTYLVRMQALPHAHGKDLVITPAQVAAVETVIDTGSSATGWSTPVGAIASTAGAIVFTATAPISFAGGVTMIRTGSVPLSGARYVAVRWSSSVPTGNRQLSLDAVGASEASRVSDTAPWNLSFFLIPASVLAAGAFTTFQFEVTFPTGAPAGTTVSIDQVSVWTGLPFIGTARQKAMALVPGGSVPTSGSIQVAHASTSLGKTIVYTHPSGTGYLPPLRPWRIASEAVTADATLLSGSRNATGPASTVFRVPISAVPQGRAEIWAWLRATSAAGVKTINWLAASVFGATPVSPLTSTPIDVSLSVLNFWYLVPLGAATLPPYLVGPGGSVEIHINGGSTVEVDEAYIFATDEGHLTVVDCGSSPASTKLWIDAPTPAVPMGAIYRGTAADRSDAFHAGPNCDTWGVHDFAPRGTSVFVATQNTIDATTALEHYRRYNTFVTRED